MIVSSLDHYNFCAKYSQLSSIPSSPERRLKNISPCRKLFADISTNQNSPNSNGFVVSNGHLTTFNSCNSNTISDSISNSSLRSPIGYYNKNLFNSTNHIGIFKKLHEKSCLDTDLTVIPVTTPNLNHQQKQQLQLFAKEANAIEFTELELKNSNTTDSLFTQNSNSFYSTTEALVVEGLSEIIYSSYKRRGSISLNLNNTNSPIKPFMDDLGFLSSINNHNLSDMTINSMTSNTSSNMATSQKKTPLVIFENESIGSDGVLLLSNPSSSLDILNSSPMRNEETKKVPMIIEIEKAIGHQKNSIHWRNRRLSIPEVSVNKNIQSRRTMSECPCPSRPLIGEISDNGLIHNLPCFDSPHDAIKRITPDILIELLNGKYSKIYDRLFVIDCRYPYEFEGGHVPGAINVNDPKGIENILLKSELPGHTLIVFHCEFSSERAPKMALHVRNLDRQLNKATYPSLFYPEMYILEGGYKNYWHQHGNRCEPPQSYLPMRNPKYRDQLRHYQKIKYAFKSGCHLSQHSGVKKTIAPIKSTKSVRSLSLNVENARKYFDDRIIQSQSQSQSKEKEKEKDSFSFDENIQRVDSSFFNSFASYSSTKSDSKHMFPSYTIPMKNSFSSIYASDLDLPSEMDDV